jgi:LmbE family N-acetylglucosaminyl deacetylase
MPENVHHVMVVVAHPDDAEFGCSGTVAKWVKEGRSVTYVIVTNGDKGSADPAMTSERLAKMREDEQRQAAQLLGVERVIFLGYPDGELEDTRSLRKDITAEIRRWRPETIVTQNPLRTLNLAGSHRDHRTTGGAVLDCVYPLARDYLSFPELAAQGLLPHKVREIYVMSQEEPDVVIDITETLSQKLNALACHVSQMGEFSKVEARVRRRAAEIGRAHGYEAAEAFRVIRIER